MRMLVVSVLNTSLATAICEKITSMVVLSSRKAALCLVVDPLRFSIGYWEWIFPGNFSIAAVSIALPFHYWSRKLVQMV